MKEAGAKMEKVKCIDCILYNGEIKFCTKREIYGMRRNKKRICNFFQGKVLLEKVIVAKEVETKETKKPVEGKVDSSQETKKELTEDKKIVEKIGQAKAIKEQKVEEKIERAQAKKGRWGFFRKKPEGG